MEELIDVVRASWQWRIVEPKQIMATSSFGNILIRDSDDQIWRLCPEELQAEIVAKGKDEYQALVSDAEFKEDWNMPELCEAATAELGPLDKGQVFCLKRPGVLGGEYSMKNVGKISLLELLACSGDLAKQIEGVPEGEDIEIDWGE